MGLKTLTDTELKEFLQMYSNSSLEFKKTIRYQEHLEELNRRQGRVITRSELLTALNKLDRLEDDLRLVLVDPEELLTLLFDNKN